MKRNSKLALLFVASILALTGCGGNNIPDAKETVHEEEAKYVTGTLHDVNVKEGGVEFVHGGQIDHKIVIPTGDDYDYANSAALFIKEHIFAATGANIDVISYEEGMEYSSSSKYIVLGVDQLSEQAGVVKTDKNLEIGGYQITTKDKSVFMYVNHLYGYQQVAYAFLVHVIGYDRISKDIINYTRDASTLPIMDIVEKPDFQLRTQSNKVDNNYSYQTGFLMSTEVLYNSSQIKFVHNSFDWVPTSYKSEHPGWFADDMSQICYTAHGNQTEYQAMVDLVFTELKACLADKPQCTKYSFTIEDNHSACSCDTCKEYATKYKAESAAIVMFLNDLDTRLQEYLEEQAEASGTEKRQVDLLFFAYNKVEKPPVELVDGKYQPTAPEVVCHDNVSVYIAPINANYNESFYSDNNYSVRETIDGWSAICKKVSYWLYETNFQEYLFPYNTFSTMANTYRYAVSHSATYLYNEGQHNQGAVTGFGRFKEYFNQKMEINVNTDYPTLVDHFFTEYFKDAKEPMLKMFNEIQEHLEYLLEEYYGEITGGIYDQISKSKYWPKKLLDQWLGYIDEAYALINHYQYSDYTLYSTLKSNICLESIFPRYALLTHHSGKYSSDDLYEMRTSFLTDCGNLNITQTRENGTVQSLKEDWGI